jgi:hypothetical protein
MRDLTLQAPDPPQLVALAVADPHAKQRRGKRLPVETAAVLALEYAADHFAAVEKVVERSFQLSIR